MPAFFYSVNGYSNMKQLFYLLCLLLLLLTACQESETPTGLVGDWIDLGNDTIVITFQEDGTLFSNDRPLLNGVVYAQPDETTLTYTFPDGNSFEFVLTLTAEQMTLRNEENGQVTIYERVTPIEALDTFLLGRWQRENSTEAFVDFNDDGTLLLIGFPGLGNGTYTVMDNQHVDLHFEEETSARPVTIFLVGDTLILRNDLDQIISLVRVE
jgi:hypothetical protein